MPTSRSAARVNVGIGHTAGPQLTLAREVWTVPAGRGVAPSGGRVFTEGRQEGSARLRKLGEALTVTQTHLVLWLSVSCALRTSRCKVTAWQPSGKSTAALSPGGSDDGERFSSSLF